MLAAAGVTALLEVADLKVQYGAGAARFAALDKITFQLGAGETVGLIGESGSGKTTLARAILRQVDVAAGRIRFDGADITRLNGKALRRLRRDVGVVFQDPFASLNPRMTVGQTLTEPLIVHGLRQGAVGRVQAMLDRVGLPRDAAVRTPQAFSGGQRQRIAIARALMLSPRLVVADEPVSALDVGVRAQVVNLMQDLQQEIGIAYLFIAHDLGIVRHVSHRVAILYCGRLVEVLPKAAFSKPRHPYTAALLASELRPHASERTRDLVQAPGEIPSPLAPPPGCRFHTRCARADALCRVAEPALTPHGPDHLAACHHPLEPLV
jgi:oligopeptide/dipeptide ABC transporter ATP-binding protein